ncbi:hypothetical protein [Glutamicibacter creatinolyticus]|uniref:hypothetical protein n=1 Tax=Glutamicibacter creatinolyticus TaxID=162496 RepID=UPI0031E139F5
MGDQDTYRDEVGHIIGTIGKLIHHVGNCFSITANRLIQAPDAEDPHPEGDVFTDTQHAYRREPSELHSDHRAQSIDDDDGGVYRLGFNNDHQEKP